MNGPTRVAIVHNYATPYRSPLFSSLGSDYDVRVLFCRRDDDLRQWDEVSNPRAFPNTVLKSVKVGGIVLNWPHEIIAGLRSMDALIVADNVENILTIIVAVLWARLSCVPVIVWNEHVAAGAPRTRSRLGNAVFRTLESVYRNLLYRAASAFLSMSGDSTDSYLTDRGVEASLIHTGTQVMPLELLTEPSATEQAEPYFLYLGYLRPEKGVERLISAFRRSSSEWPLIIAGSGPDEARLRDLSQDDDRIQFVGHVGGSEKASLISGAAALIVPSVYEPWGMVVNEALHYRTPVICSSTVSARVLVSGDVGLVFDSDDLDSLTRAIEEIHSNEPLRRRLGAGLAEYDQHAVTDPETGIQHFRAALDQVAGGVGGGSGASSSGTPRTSG